MCAVCSTTKQARARVDSSIHHPRPAFSAPEVVHDTPQQSMILLQLRGSIGASSGASDVAKTSWTRTSTITLRGPRRTKRYVSLGGGGAWGGPATRIFLQLRTVGTNMCPQVVESEREESNLEFSGFSAFEEEQEEEGQSVSAVVEESEGDGPEVPRGSRGRGRARGRSRSPASSGDEGWTEDTTPPVMNPHEERPGITVPVPTTVLDFVQLFLTKELLAYFVDETNDYARYCREELHVTLSYKWHRCNMTDMAHYLWLLVLFGLLICGDVRQYWHHGFFMATPNVSGLMTRDAFLAMDQYFHIFNRRAIPRGNQDKLILVRPLMEYLQDQCRMLVVPLKNLSLDEGLLAYKGRLSIKVYNPKKPKKYGVKFFFVTKSHTGYVLDFSIYSGVFSTLRDTVLQLVDRFRDKGYHLFMDNYYNSIALAQELSMWGSTAVGPFGWCVEPPLSSNKSDKTLACCQKARQCGGVRMRSSASFGMTSGSSP